MTLLEPVQTALHDVVCNAAGVPGCLVYIQSVPRASIVCVAACLLLRWLPALVSGTAKHTKRTDLARGLCKVLCGL